MSCLNTCYTARHFPLTNARVPFNDSKMVGGRGYDGQLRQLPLPQQDPAGSAQAAPPAVQQAFFVVVRFVDDPATWHRSPFPSGPGSKHSGAPPGKLHVSAVHGAHAAAKHCPVQYDAQVHAIGPSTPAAAASTAEVESRRARSSATTVCAVGGAAAPSVGGSGGGGGCWAAALAVLAACAWASAVTVYTAVAARRRSVAVVYKDMMMQGVRRDIEGCT